MKMVVVAVLMMISTLSNAAVSSHIASAKVKKDKKKKTVLDISKNTQLHTSLSSNKAIVVLPKNVQLEDCVVVVIYCQDSDPIVLTKKDFERASINGAPRTQQETIDFYELAHYARYKYKMDVPDDMIEKYIQGIMDEHNLSRAQIKQMFEQVGYSLQEGTEQLKMMYLVDNLLSYKIKSRVLVSEEEIQAYDAKHPEYTQAAYDIQTGFVPQGTLTEEQIADWKHEAKKCNDIEWTNTYTLQDDEISEERAFIKDLPLNVISELERVEGGYEVTRVVDKKTKQRRSLDVRRKEITEKLRAPRFDKLLEEFKKELAQEFEVVYLKA